MEINRLLFKFILSFVISMIAIFIVNICIEMFNRSSTIENIMGIAFLLFDLTFAYILIKLIFNHKSKKNENAS
jgi:hypothetical protein